MRRLVAAYYHLILATTTSYYIVRIHIYFNKFPTNIFIFTLCHVLCTGYMVFKMICHYNAYIQWKTMASDDNDGGGRIAVCSRQYKVRLHHSKKQ